MFGMRQAWKTIRARTRLQVEERENAFGRPALDVLEVVVVDDVDVEEQKRAQVVVVCADCRGN